MVMLKNWNTFFFVRPHLRFVHPLNKGTQLSSIKAEILCIIEFDFTCGYKGFSK